MRRALSVSLALVVSACAFEVNLAARAPITPGGDAGAGGGGGAPGCTVPQLTAYEVTLAAMPVPPECTFDGGVALVEETFTAMFLVGSKPTFSIGPTDDRTTLALHGLTEQTLGDAPPIKLGEAFAGVDRTFEWDDTLTTFERVGGPATVRHANATFVFDRLDTPLTAGTLQLSSRWWCVPGPQGGCPPALPFVASCQLTRSFVAQRTTVPAAWIPMAQPVPNAQQLIASIEVGELESEGQYCWGSPAPRLVQRAVKSLRRLERWQYDAPALTLHVPERTIALGDAPSFTYGPMFSLATTPQQRVVSTLAAPDAVETRTTFVAVNANACVLPGGTTWFPQPVVVFQSAYACDGGGCDSVTSTDVGTCNPGAMPFTAVPLEAGPFAPAP